MNATVLKFLIWIPYEKIADTCFFFFFFFFFFFGGGGGGGGVIDRIMPLFELWPFEKNMDAILSAKYLKKLLKLEP